MLTAVGFLRRDLRLVSVVDADIKIDCFIVLEIGVVHELHSHIIEILTNLKDDYLP
jgi:hypothetical protein